MIRRNCIHCGKFTYPTKQQIKNGHGKYCSRSCSNKHDNPMKKDPSKWVTINCSVCGEDFEEYKSNVKRHNIRYCSIRCGGIARRGKYEPHNKKHIDKEYCNHCGDEIDRKKIVQKKSMREQRGCINTFCSSKCVGLYQRKHDSKLLSEEYLRLRSKISRKELDDVYVAGLIQRAVGVSSKYIPQELIELKRLNIKRKRIIRTNK